MDISGNILHRHTCVSNDKIELIFHFGLCINRTTQQMSLKANSSEPCLSLLTDNVRNTYLQLLVINLIIEKYKI